MNIEVGRQISASLTSGISCEGCPVGGHAIYAPAFARDPGEITNRRILRRSFRARQTVLREGEVPTHVFTVFSGWAYAYKFLPGGGRQVLGFFIPGDLISLYSFLDDPSPYAIKALTPLEVCGFERRNLFEFLQSEQALREQLCKMALGMCRIGDEKLVNVARRPAASRVAYFLIVVQRRLRERGLAGTDRFVFPVPQSVMADALGITPVYLNRTLMALRKSGIIDFRRQELIIRDVAALKRVVDGEWTSGES